MGGQDLGDGVEGGALGGGGLLGGLGWVGVRWGCRVG